MPYYWLFDSRAYVDHILLVSVGNLRHNVIDNGNHCLLLTIQYSIVQSLTLNVSWDLYCEANLKIFC